ncbi:MAG TPA: type II secretion system F family protein [Chlamydiales bacterium]|nr:MAG: hypothetical protein A3F67_11120 [Verrucomicrobia bacterium RIFCSPHIGHO2_12_FULL_41_10]HLB53109.1 type II secretion system F family protein [Chlamydiales bacterium]
MSLFRYQALSETGKKVQATIDAVNLQEAKQKLLRLKVIAIRLEEVSSQDVAKALTKGELLALTREIARLLQAGLPLYETLAALEEKYRGMKPHAMLLDLSSKVKTGRSLSHLLKEHSQTFDLLYISMVANAEKTGRLTESFEELAQLITRQLQVRKAIVGALLYPALLSCFCLIVFSSLLFFVVPSLSELFEGRNLHPFTKIVFAVSAWACACKTFFLFLFLLFVAVLFTACFSKKGKEKCMQIAAHLPFFKPLLAKVALIRFTRSMATLLEGGVPLLGALTQARTSIYHVDLERLVATAEQKIAEGTHLSLCFENQPLIPPLVPRMFAIAEQSGKFSFTMQQIAQIYEEELEIALANFANFAQPILLLILGGLVGFVLLSVLLPLTDVGSFAT